MKLSELLERIESNYKVIYNNDDVTNDALSGFCDSLSILCITCENDTIIIELF